ncbi:MAG: beta strand repeat-containing protein [Bacteroidales bacterium]
MKTRYLLFSLIIFLSLSYCTSQLFAITKTWVPTNGGAWTTAGNWSPSGMPASGDDVYINSDQSAAITRSSSNGEIISLNSLYINGNVRFEFDPGSANNCTLIIMSDFSVASGKTFTVGINNTGRMNFAIAASATATVNGTVYMNSYSGSGYDRTFTNSGDITISSGGLISGQNSSDFILNSGATLQLANTAGITTSGATGAVQIPGARTFNVGANYVYNGSSNQNIGNGFPTNLTGSLTINNSGATVTLDNARTIANGGNIYLTNGTFAAGTNLTMSTTSTINRSGGSMTGTPQGGGTYNVIYTANSKTAGTELSGTGLYDVTVNLTAGQTLTSSATVITVDNDLTVTQGEFVLSATNGNYSFKNVIVTANGTLTHSVPWDNVPNRLVSISGNLAVTGIFNPTVRSHVNMNTAGTKTIQTGDNPSSTLSILTFNDGTFSASGTLKTNQEVWAMFGTGGSFSTNGNNVTFSSMNNNNGTVNVNGGSLTVNGDCVVGFGVSAGLVSLSSGTFTVVGSLSVSNVGSLTCSGTPLINIGGGFSNQGTFTPASSTVTLNGSGTQVLSGTLGFYNLALAGTGTKAFNSARTISNNLSIASGANANLGTVTSTANTLTLGGSGTMSGSWGSSISPATHTNDTYFSLNSGIVNIASETCPTVTAAVNGQTDPLCNGGSDGSITIQGSGGVSPYSYSVNNGSSWISSGSNPYVYGGLQADTPYRIKIKDNNGCESR